MTPEQIEQRIEELEEQLTTAQECGLAKDTYDIQCELDNLYQISPGYYCTDCG